jgi:hypothetical protein
MPGATILHDRRYVQSLIPQIANPSIERLIIGGEAGQFFDMDRKKQAGIGSGI